MKGNVSTHAGVSIIISTNRPHCFNNLIKNYVRQLYAQKEMIVILNNDRMELKKYRKLAEKYANVSVYKLPEQMSLGRCLNFAARKAKYAVITKFDDDDFYSPYYLKEQMLKLHRAQADLIGKRAYLAYIEGQKLIVQRFPRQQNKMVKWVAGGTIAFKRHVFQKVQFPNKSLGEDVGFLSKCRSKGYRLYASSPYNYVQIRRANKQTHTWKGTDDYVLKGSRVVAKTENYKLVATRKC